MSATVVDLPQRQTSRRHRSPHGPGLYVTDEELIDILGVPRDVALVTIRGLENRDRTFPRKQPLFGDRRYLPAVMAYLDKLEGVKSPSRDGGRHD